VKKLIKFICCKTLILLLLCFFHEKLIARIGVTNVATAEPTARLFGDCVNEYIKARWFAYKYNLDFYFQPFNESARLKASTDEIVLSQHIRNSFSRHIAVNNESDIIMNMQEGTLFFIQPYARGNGYVTEDFLNYLLFNGADGFIKKMRPFLQLKKSLPSISLPDNIIKVAVHIRRPLAGFEGSLYSVQEYDSSLYKIDDVMFHLKEGKLTNTSIKELPSPLNCHSKPPVQFSSGYYGESAHPAKLPPTQFYIDAIKKLSEFFGETPLYVYFFSNDVRPQGLYDSIKNGVNKKNITYGWSDCNLDSRSDSRAIDDCYYMSQFDCLIKSISTFSTIAQFLGNHAITITPGEYFWDENKVIINKRLWFIMDEVVNKIVLNIQ
jgi:hypothetical protein